MTTQVDELQLSPFAYPKMSEAAAMLSIDPSLLSRYPNLDLRRAGRREKRVPARQVLEVGGVYRRRSLNDVAADLVRYAREHAPEAAEGVEEEVEQFFEAGRTSAADPGALLADLRRALPPELFEKVKTLYESVRNQHVSRVGLTGALTQDEAERTGR